MRQVLGLLVVSLVVCVSFSAVSGGAEDDSLARVKRAPLKGLKGVGVTVEDLPAEVEEIGLTRTKLETDVELRLRKAGIRVLDETERLPPPGSPYLYVNVNVHRIGKETGYWPFSIYVALSERVRLERNPEIVVDAATWSTGCIAAGPTDSLPRGVRDYVGDMVDIFCNDYLAANPKGEAGASTGEGN